MYSRRYRWTFFWNRGSRLMNVDEGRSQHDLLAHALGHVLAKGVSVIAKLEELDHPIDLGRCFLHLTRPADEPEVLVTGQEGRGRLELGHDPHPGPHLHRAGGKAYAKDASHPIRGLQLTRQDPQQCGLPSSVGAEETEELSPVDRQVHVLEGDDPSKGLTQSLDLYYRFSRLGGHGPDYSQSR
jgi:hypothetical protein